MAKLRFKTTRSTLTEPDPGSPAWAPPVATDAVDPDHAPSIPGAAPAEPRDVTETHAPASEDTASEETASEDTTSEDTTTVPGADADEPLPEPAAPRSPAVPLFARLRDGLSSSWAGDRYARRRFALLCTVALVLGVLASRSYGSHGSQTSDVARFADVDVVDQPVTQTPLTEVLDDAAAFKARTGTFSGFAAPGVLVAAATNTVVLASVHDKVCTYTAIEDGVRRDVLVDQTGSACTRASIDEVQAQLALESLAPADEAVERLRELVPAVRRAALMYASLTYTAGTPSLAGLAEVPVPGATLRSVSPDGSYAVFELREGSTCRVVRIHADAARQPSAMRPC